MNYTVLKDKPKTGGGTIVSFEDAQDGSAYKDPHDGSVRVKVGEIYLRFTKKGVVEGYLPHYWPISTLSDYRVNVNISLYLEGL
jgi:hypothetical protein